MWDYFVLSPIDDSFFIFRCVSFNAWKYLCLRQKSAVLGKPMNNSLICEHGANNAEGWHQSTHMHLTWAECSSVMQSYYSYPLAFCEIPILRCLMWKAVSTVISFSSLQAWPEGRLEPTSQGTQSLLAPKPCSGLVSFQLLQGSHTAARL